VEQLEQLQRQIEGKLSDRTEGVDIGYWESLLSQLKAHTARGRLRDRHQQLLRSKLAQLKAEQLGKAGTGGGAESFRRPTASKSEEQQQQQQQQKEEEWRHQQQRQQQARSSAEEDTEEEEAEVRLDY
jgi:hypothetical protein